MPRVSHNYSTSFIIAVSKYKNMNYNMRGSDQVASVVEGTKVLKIMSSIVWLYFVVLTITDFCV